MINWLLELAFIIILDNATPWVQFRNMAFVTAFAETLIFECAQALSNPDGTLPCLLNLVAVAIAVLAVLVVAVDESPSIRSMFSRSSFFAAIPSGT